MTETKEFNIGDKVYFTDKTSTSFEKYSKWFGIVLRAKEDTDLIPVAWYIDKNYNSLVRKTIFYSRRLSLSKPFIEKTKEERIQEKCKSLWNKSKWVQKNPKRAY